MSELPEHEIDVPVLNKKVMVRTADGSAGSLRDAFAFVSGLIANGKLKDPDAGLNPRHPSHEIAREADGRYHLHRLLF